MNPASYLKLSHYNTIMTLVSCGSSGQFWRYDSLTTNHVCAKCASPLSVAIILVYLYDNVMAID